MAQNTVNYSNNPTGPQLLDDYLAKDQENHLTCNSGIQRPSYAQNGTTWLDNSTTPWVLKMYDGTTDVSLLSINPTTHKNITTNIDEISITHNSSDELQAVGVVNQNNTSTALKSWSGTKAQYDAIVNKDNNTLYHITDDTDMAVNLLQAIYPVGSIYIGTMTNCPLAGLFGTWTKVSEGKVLQGSDNEHSAGSTINAGLPNITGSIETATANSEGMGALIVGNKTQANAGLNSYTSNVCKIELDASNSNPIYGNSNTVQPPAFVVNIWQRTT